MPEEETFDTPIDAEPGKKLVHIYGPSNIDVRMTPMAALESARRIGDAAVEVLVQNGNIDTDDAPDPTSTDVRPESG